MKINDTATCPKCGEQTSRLRYVQGVSLSGFDDALERTCGRCGYAWSEPTLDNLPEEPQEETK